MATSGLRRAELLALQWPDVDLAKARLRIHGKGDKHREVLIFPELAAHLHALHVESDLPRTGPVFRGRQGRALQQSTLQRWFTLWCQRAVLTTDNGDHFTLHSLRRFAAKQWLNHGLNIRHVQILLGHNDLQTTIRYLNDRYIMFAGRRHERRGEPGPDQILTNTRDFVATLRFCPWKFCCSL